MTDLPPIRERSIGAYLDALGSSQPAPGGGSVAGLVGALAAALGQMVISLTVKRDPNDELDQRFDALTREIDALLAAAEADERAYAGYIAASRLPKVTDDDKATRRAAMQSALVNAAEAPLGLASSAGRVLDHLGLVAAEGTTHALSDAEIAISLAEASVIAGLANVRINIPLIKDAAIAADLSARGGALESNSRAQASALRATLADRRLR